MGVKSHQFCRRGAFEGCSLAAALCAVSSTVCDSVAAQNHLLSPLKVSERGLGRIWYGVPAYKII